jgi:hypothetical protein
MTMTMPPPCTPRPPTPSVGMALTSPEALS